jgi:CRISPR/Cas system CSM-associated protein Csm3 (group 7 of RAMP superfamily)
MVYLIIKLRKREKKNMLLKSRIVVEREKMWRVCLHSLGKVRYEYHPAYDEDDLRYRVTAEQNAIFAANGYEGDYWVFAHGYVPEERKTA